LLHFRKFLISTSRNKLLVKSYRVEAQAKESGEKMPYKLLPVAVRDPCLNEFGIKGNESSLKGMTLCPVGTKQKHITNEKQINEKEREREEGH